jgi:Na+-transporting NADH:ubiquinone oxidoreductase subunit F
MEEGLRERFYTDEFKKIEKEFPISITTSHFLNLYPKTIDGTHGFIHNVLFENYLNHEAPEDIEYYICGPPMMNAAVFKMLELGVPPENIAFDDFG